MLDFIRTSRSYTAFLSLQMNSTSSREYLDMVLLHFVPHMDTLHANGQFGSVVNSDVNCCSSDFVSFITVWIHE